MESSNTPEPEQGSPSPAAERHRSPNYPAFSLVVALEKAESFFRKNGRTSVPAAVACTQWDVKITSGTGLRLISTMLAFGLVVEGGVTGKKSLRISDRAFVLLRHPDKTSAEFQEALRDAALSPRIHFEVAEHYKEHWPEDGVLGWELQNHWKFNPAVVDTVICEIKETFE